jgi:periplasmic protein TonB
MAGRKRFFQLAMLAALAALFAFPPQLLHGQETPEVKRKIKTQVTPAYPELARRMSVHGKVKLQVTVAPDGNVKSVHVLGGHPLLVAASQEAARQWKFESGPKETTQIIEFNFE